MKQEEIKAEIQRLQTVIDGAWARIAELTKDLTRERSLDRIKDTGPTLSVKDALSEFEKCNIEITIDDIRRACEDGIIPAVPGEDGEWQIRVQHIKMIIRDMATNRYRNWNDFARAILFAAYFFRSE